jgi:hypothetical protein
MDRIMIILRDILIVVFVMVFVVLLCDLLRIDATIGVFGVIILAILGVFSE